MNGLRRRVWVEVDLNALRRNFSRIAAAVKPAKVLCVVKANAYGLGVIPYARVLAGEKSCIGFGVAEPFEALQMLDAMAAAELPRRDVQMLSSVLPDEVKPMVKAGVTLPITDLASARRISSAACALGRMAKVHVKIDTGMGRLGIRSADAVNVVCAVARLPGLDMEGIFSHFPVASEPSNSFTQRQIDEFISIVRKLKTRGISFRRIHIAASDAINNFPRAARAPFNVVRAGLDLHGSFDPNGRRNLKVENVLTLKARVAQVRNLPPGTTLGYGRTWCLDRRTRVATISAGYADGIPLAIANRSHVLIKGVACPVIGRVSMDYVTVDASGVPDVKPGDEVVCLGGTGTGAIMPDDWGRMKGTHAYDVICSLGNRVERVYL